MWKVQGAKNRGLRFFAPLRDGANEKSEEEVKVQCDNEPI
jgi:hypothetical protein